MNYLCQTRIERTREWQLPFRKIALVLLSTLLSLGLSAQADFYNAFFEKVEGIDDVREYMTIVRKDCKMVEYDINGIDIIEFYNKADNSFFGISFDDEKVPADKIKILKKNKSLRESIKKFGLAYGSAKYFKKPIVGLTREQVEDILGQPDKLKFSIEGNTQLIYYTYANRGVMKFENGLLVKSLNDKTNKKQIAIKL